MNEYMNNHVCTMKDVSDSLVALFATVQDFFPELDWLSLDVIQSGNKKLEIIGFMRDGNHSMVINSMAHLCILIDEKIAKNRILYQRFEGWGNEVDK